MKGKNRRGSTLIITIIIFVVLMILGTFILGFMVNENKMSLNHQRKIQAYYIARAGAEAIEAALFSMDDIEVNELLEQEEIKNEVIVDPISFGNGITNISLKKDKEKNQIIINAVGKLGNVEESLIKTINIQKSTDIDMDLAIFAGESLEFEENYNAKSVEGDIVVTKEGAITGGKFVSSKVENRKYPIIDDTKIPVIENKSEANSVSSINSSIEFINSSVEFNGTEIFTHNNDIDIVVNEVNFPKNGDEFKIHGTGKVRLFVKNKILFNEVSHINKDGNPSQLEIFYFGTDPIVLYKLNKFNCNLFIKNANVNCIDNSKVGLIYAPNSKVDWVGNGEIQGLIGNEIILDNNVKISKPPDMSVLPVELLDMSIGTGNLIILTPGYFK